MTRRATGPCTTRLTVRHPADRSVSFHPDERRLFAGVDRSQRVRHKRLTELPSFEHVAAALLDMRAAVPMHRQLLYLSRRSSLTEALDFIDTRMDLAAPAKRLSLFLDMMRDRIGPGLRTDAPDNRTPRAEYEAIRIDPAIRARLEAEMRGDIALYDHVRSAFDACTARRRREGRPVPAPRPLRPGCVGRVTGRG